MDLKDSLPSAKKTRRLKSSHFLCAHLAWMPSFVQLFFPFASRPWRRVDLDDIQLDDHGNRNVRVPYLNVKGFVDFHNGDPEDPRNWSAARSWYISAAAIFLAFNGAVASSVTGSCVQSISTEFGVSEVAGSVTTTIFILGYCAGPFVFAPFSEFYGRRWLIYTTFTGYVACNFLCAFAPNFASLLIGRLLTGTLVSASLAATPGILADLWNPIERGNSIALLAVCTWAGPSMGPVVAAFIDEAKGWRWVFYFVLMLGGGGLLAMITIPETHSPTITAQKARRHRLSGIPGFETVKTEPETRDVSLLSTYKIALTRPWALLFDPISLCCNIYLAIVFALQFMLFSIYPIVFEQIRGWDAADAELPLLGAVVGPILGAIVVVADTKRRQRKHKRIGWDLDPEEHLVIAKIGGVGFAVTMFWFTWTAPFTSIHWICPTLAGVFLSASLLLVFVAILNYLIETYFEYAASIVAVNTIARSLGSASAPLFTNFMFDAMGVGGGGSLIGGVAVLLAIIPFFFYKYGKKIRMKSKYPSTITTHVYRQASGDEHFFRA